MSQLNILNKRIESFITRYYLNELIKGAIFFAAILISLFLVVVVLEYYGRFSSQIRTVLFGVLLLSFLGLLFKYVAFPLFRIMKLAKRMDYHLAASIIGESIPEVKDKLLNTLQLSAVSGTNSDLVMAALQEREEKLSIFQFDKVIDLSFNKRYLKYLLFPVVVFVAIWFWDGSLIVQPTSRIVQFNRNFVVPSPFEFNVSYSDKVFSGEDFPINVELIGKEIPSELFVVVGGKNYRMKKNGGNKFEYTIPNLSKELEFFVKDEKYTSDIFNVKILKQPLLSSFDMYLDFPNHVNMEDIKLRNVGDYSVPFGTQIKWKVSTKDVDEMYLMHADTSEFFAVADDGFEMSHNLKNDLAYKFVLSNKNRVDSNSIWYNLDVVKDEYPLVNFETAVDSLFPSNVLMRGSIRDDYGFTKLQLVFKLDGIDSIVPIDIEKSVIQQEFFYQIDFKSLAVHSKKVEYYFEVYDNDGVNGPKRSKSHKKMYNELSAQEKFEKVDDLSNSLKDKMENHLKDADKLNERFNDFEKKIQEKKKIDWNDKNEFKKLINDKKELLDELKDTQKELNQISEFSEKELELDQELLEKQKQLEELFDKVMNDEMKQLLDELEQMMDDLNKEQMKEKLDELNMDNEALKDELDRNLELFKQLEFEQNFDQMMDRMSELQEKQEELSNEKGDKEELKEKQDSLNNEFDKLAEDLEKLKEQNEALEEPNDVDFEEELKNEIQQEMENSSEQLENNKKKQASKSQKNAANKMKQMQQKMSQSMEGSESQQQEEDMQALRQIMENLLQISFNQEGVMNRLDDVSSDNPLVVSSNKEQKIIKDDFRIVSDSLKALSKRIAAISPEINRELVDIDYNMKKSIESLAERKVSEGLTHQQYVMTSTNNLALLLDEIMQQMQQQMQQQNKSGKGNCKKPGQSGNPSMSRMKSMQKQLKKQLQKMKDEMGKNKNGKKPGGKPGQGGQMSMQLAKMAAQQSAIRDQLRKLADKIGKEGNKSGSDQLKKIADMMDENQEDIIQKRITQETLKRQQEIEVKLLESEKALREEGEDNKRESRENQQEFEIKNKVLEEYFNKKNSEIELLRKVPVELNPYFKEKNTNYYDDTVK